MYTNVSCSFRILYIYFSVVKYITVIALGIKLNLNNDIFIANKKDFQVYLDFQHKYANGFLLLAISARTFSENTLKAEVRMPILTNTICQNIRDSLANHILK
jgi:hypothetical protein